ncbi:MAG: mucoidy inhibitor MuiA family protein [Balneola sp.]
MLSLILLLLTSPFHQVTSDSVIVKSEIENVTVFRSQAQIERNSDVRLSPGKNVVVFTELSESMIPNSIQLKGKDAFTLLSITHRNNFIEERSNSKLVNQLTSQRDSLQRLITSKRARINVINSNVSLLNSSNNIANNHKLSASELDALLDLNSKRLLEFEEQKIVLNNEISTINDRVRLLNNRIREEGRSIRNRFKEVVAEIEVESAKEIEFSLQYLVYNSGWNPSYDIRSENINAPLAFTYKANIYQNTGYDWNNVQFTINSGDPSQNVQKPELAPNYVGFYTTRQKRNRSSGGNSVATFRRSEERGLIEGIVMDQTSGEPVPGASVIIPELNKRVSTTVDGLFELDNIPNGTYTLRVNYVGYRSLNKRFSINNSGLNVFALLAADVFGLDEVVVTGVSDKLQGRASGVAVENEVFVSSAPIQNQEISNQTSFSYKIERPYSVPSDGKEHTLEIKRETPQTDYLYASVPKLSSNAYLIGNLTDWDELNLIEGDANVYFENSFVGSTYLDPSSLLDTLEISLGKDERIIIERKKLKDFEERRFFGSKTRESLSFEISIRNTKSESIDIIIEDQIPVSTDESIKVSPKELSGGELDKNSGIIRWKLKIEPNGTKKIILNYELEYPKGKRINY